MTVYLLLYLIPVCLALSYFRANKSLRLINELFLFFLFSLVIGMRWEVGGDWATYLKIMESARNVSFNDALHFNDPGYMALNWVSLKLGFDIFGVNIICGCIFIWGLLMFCKKQPLSWLAFSIATPYLLIVVAMGYTRQGAALGFVFFALGCLQDKRTYFFIFYTLVGALFHKSAVFLLPLYFLCNHKNGILSSFFSLFLILLVGGALIVDSFASQWSMYVDDQMQSDGAFVRVLMNLIPSIVFFMYRKKWKARWDDSYLIVKWLSVAGILGLPFLQVASTATDRIALYIAPVQLLVYSRLPLMVGGYWRSFSLLAIIVFYGVVLIYWLNFSYFAQNYWIPYQWPGLNK